MQYVRYRTIRVNAGIPPLLVTSQRQAKVHEQMRLPTPNDVMVVDVEPINRRCYPLMQRFI